jgi:FKBP-type peptidyl-prolyl cis-trans isomerase
MKFRIFLLLGLLAGSCGSGPTAPDPDRHSVSSVVVGKQFERANQALLRKENDEMDAYERIHDLHFNRTPAGIRFITYVTSAKGDSVRLGMNVSLNYTVSTLSGDVCYTYSYPEDRPFRVGEAPAESGIQRGITFLKKGDKALLLIPSFMAHGLLGDLNRIPPQMPLVCRVEIGE